MTIDGPRWFALWTHSHCEQLVRDQLQGKAFTAFLPTVRQWSQRAGTRRLIPVPMFPGYLFVHDLMDKQRYTEVLKTRGVVRILGEGWDRLASIPDAEIEAIQQIVSTDVPVLPYPYLAEGARVRINAGALAGVEGLFVRSKPKQGLLVVSVDLLRRSVAVEVGCDAVEPIASTSAAAPPDGCAFADACR